MNVTTLPRIGFYLAFITFITFPIVYKGILRSINQKDSRPSPSDSDSPREVSTATPQSYRFDLFI